MRNVIYVAPFPMAMTMKFAAALSSLEDVRLFGVFQVPPSVEMRGLFYQIVTVKNALSVGELDPVIARITSRYGSIHRLMGILENIQERRCSVFLGFRALTTNIVRPRYWHSPAWAQKASPMMLMLM